jgi:hypothetical protein
LRSQQQGLNAYVGLISRYPDVSDFTHLLCRDLGQRKRSLLFFACNEFLRFAQKMLDCLVFGKFLVLAQVPQSVQSSLRVLGAAKLMLRSIEIECLIVVLLIVPCTGAPVMKLNAKYRKFQWLTENHEIE